MNITIFGTVIKWISCLVVGFASIIGGTMLDQEKIVLENLNEEKSLDLVHEFIPYETTIIYNEKIPSNITKVVTKGEFGIQTLSSNLKKVKIKDPITEVIEIGSGMVGEYVGKLTSYSPDCVGCSKLGNVACHTKTKGKHSLVSDGIYYRDDDYGNIRILSAATVFPCGTIIQIDNGKTEPFYGVVLDRGGSMNTAWKNGNVWIDLAYASKEDVKNGNTSSNQTKFTVQRWGF